MAYTPRNILRSDERKADNDKIKRPQDVIPINASIPCFTINMITFSCLLCRDDLEIDRL